MELLIEDFSPMGLALEHVEVREQVQMGSGNERCHRSLWERSRSPLDVYVYFFFFTDFLRSLVLKRVGFEDTNATTYFSQKLLNSLLEGQSPQLPPYLRHSFLSLVCNMTDRQHLA